jgi:DNA-binding response OmpR family regulator
VGVAPAEPQQHGSAGASPSQGQARREPRLSDTDAGSEHEAGPAQKKRVLVVEDNDANRVMLCRRLSKQGFVTVEARDGREALDRVREYRFDLVLLDIMMPDVDGYQVLQTIKADDDLKALPVIMISAVDEMASVVRCIEMGAEDYLPKPYDPVLLQARINACLDKRRLRDQELAYLRAVSELTKAAAQVERGEFDPAVLAAVAGRDDALGTLARVFDRMAREVQARVRQLKEEVERLRVMVEIDQKKKDEELAAVNRQIDTLGLEEKAEAIRAARDRRRAARVTRPPVPDPRAETVVAPYPIKPKPGQTPPPDAS